MIITFTAGPRRTDPVSGGSGPSLRQILGCGECISTSARPVIIQSDNRATKGNGPNPLAHGCCINEGLGNSDLRKIKAAVRTNSVSFRKPDFKASEPNTGKCCAVLRRFNRGVALLGRCDDYGLLLSLRPQALARSAQRWEKDRRNDEEALSNVDIRATGENRACDLRVGSTG